MIRICSVDGCSTELGKKNTTGKCKPCRGRELFASPEHEAKRRAGAAAHSAKPEVKARRAAQAREWNRNPSPAEVIRRSEHGKHLARTYLQTPEMRAKILSAEARKRAGQSVKKKAYADIPEHLWDEVRRLNRQLHIPAADARRMVLEEHERKERRRLAAMSPFERQEERLRKGASVVAKFNPRRADPSYTLGGVVGAIA